MINLKSMNVYICSCSVSNMYNNGGIMVLGASSFAEFRNMSLVLSISFTDF